MSQLPAAGTQSATAFGGEKKTGPAEYKARFTGESSGDWTGLEDR